MHQSTRHGQGTREAQGREVRETQPLWGAGPHSGWSHPADSKNIRGWFWTCTSSPTTRPSRDVYDHEERKRLGQAASRRRRRSHSRCIPLSREPVHNIIACNIAEAENRSADTSHGVDRGEHTVHRDRWDHCAVQPAYCVLSVTRAAAYTRITGYAGAVTSTLGFGTLVYSIARCKLMSRMPHRTMIHAPPVPSPWEAAA